MTDPVSELVLAAKAAVEWMEEATCPNEVVMELRRLQRAVKQVEDQNEERQRKDGNDGQTAV